ncbi:PXA domain-containing protein [Blastocladiella britannica]|nr:PXA domain-containing protein [Blastocladiella britannica]
MQILSIVWSLLTAGWTAVALWASASVLILLLRPSLPASQHLSQQQKRRQSEYRQILAKQHLRLRSDRQFHTSGTVPIALLATALGLTDASPAVVQVHAALTTLLRLVHTTFIGSWFRLLSNDPSFPKVVEARLAGAVSLAIKKCVSIDPFAVTVGHLGPVLLAHLLSFRKAQLALGDRNDDALNVLLAEKYVASGQSLHSALHLQGATASSELAHLRTQARRILEMALPGSLDLASPPTSTLLVEIVASVLLKIMDALSDPHFWNATIDFAVGQAIRERNLVHRVRRVLEEQAASPVPLVAFRSVDELLESIKTCPTLIEAKQLRNQIIMEVRRRRAELASQTFSDQVIAGLQCLLSAKTKIEKRIAALGGPEYMPRNRTVGVSFQHISFSQLLRSSVGLTYFMEFLDRTGRSHYLQFWLAAQHFDGVSKRDYESLYSTFFEPASPSFIAVPSELWERLAVLASDDEHHPQFAAFREAQALVARLMEDVDFSSFSRSDLFLAMINDKGFIADREQAPDSLLQPPTPFLAASTGAYSPVTSLSQPIGSDLAGALPLDALSDEYAISDDLDLMAARLPAVLSSSIADLASSPFATSDGATATVAAPPSSPAMAIDRLMQQSDLIEGLLRNPTVERQELVSALEKSRAQLRREIRAVTWQNLQQRQSKLEAGAYTVSIPSFVVRRDQSKKDYAEYALTVVLANTSTRWTAYRRFSDFLALHTSLKRHHAPLVTRYDLPIKAPILSDAMVSSIAALRLDKLRQYLAQITSHEEIRTSAALRAFVSEAGGPVESSGGGSTVLPLKLTERASELLFGGNRMSASPPLSNNTTTSGTGSTSATEPKPSSSRASDILADLFIEAFDLKDRGNWLRRQAVLFALNQVFDDTIERKLSQVIAGIFKPASLKFHLEYLTDSFWPGGTWRTDWPLVTDEERVRVQKSSKQQLQVLLPDLLGAFIGSQNAVKGARRVHVLAQNQLLNRHLLYTVLDVIVEQMTTNLAQKE